jgi:UDP-N-acetyl-D-mannosaminouronate:lipid I N-acetyl-D-mannosaminouronosyltransferase
MNPVLLYGIKTYPFHSPDELIAYAADRKGILIAVNAEKLMHSNGEMRSTINNNIGYPDGIGAVWALRKKKNRNVVKIPGCELWLHIVRRFYHEKSFYIVGSRPDVIEKAIYRLKTEFPGINIIGYRDGYLKNELEKQSLIRDISEKKPDIVFVAMGSPKQELLMAEMQRAHKALYQGLGGSIDIYTGTLKRAPKLIQQIGLEWAYRLLQEPYRFKRHGILLKFFFIHYFSRSI